MFVGPNGLHRILHIAYENGASDIHLDPLEDLYQIRLRQNGQLIIQEEGCDRSCVQALKMLAHIDLSEKRVARDGHFTWDDQGVGMEVRVSAIPTISGFKYTLRCLALHAKALHLHEIGLTTRDYGSLQVLLRSKEGLILASGSTGSGKTTSLYAMVTHVAGLGQHVISLENPVERKIPGITQIEIDTGSLLTFSDGIRAALRQDPDVMMIGEIRDSITAEAAVQASLTGHLVLTSIHATDSIRTLARVVELGVKPIFLRYSLLGVLAHESMYEHSSPHPLFKLTTSPYSNLSSDAEQEGTLSSMIAERPDPLSSLGNVPLEERSSAFVRGWLDFTK